jgi:hypothetical protein
MTPETRLQHVDVVLAFEIDGFREQLITRSDDAGVCLERLLRPDQLNKLAGEIDVGDLQGSRLQGPRAAVARAGHNGLAREHRFTEEILPHRLETSRTGEFGQRHTFQIQRLPLSKIAHGPCPAHQY